MANSDTGYPLRIHRQNSVLSIFARFLFPLASPFAPLFTHRAPFFSLFIALAIYPSIYPSAGHVRESTNQALMHAKCRGEINSHPAVRHLSHAFSTRRDVRSRRGWKNTFQDALVDGIVLYQDRRSPLRRRRNSVCGTNMFGCFAILIRMSSICSQLDVN